MGEQRQRLDRAAGLRGDEEQGVALADRLMVQRRLDRLNPGGVGRVEHVQLRPARTPRERAAQHLGGERGATHAQQHDMLESGVARLGREQLERAQLRELPLGDRQPAQAVADLGRSRRSPQRRVAFAQPRGDTLLCGCRQPLVDRSTKRRGDTRVHSRSRVAHATIVVTAALV